MGQEPEKSMDEVIRQDGRYPADAYTFLYEGLGRAVEVAYGKEPLGGHHHVTGRQLCTALRDLAIEKWGMLAPAVLKRWNIHATIDFGNMIYLLVENNIMGKTPEDSIEDFRDVYDFAAAFDIGEEFDLAE
jgi:uncharacterized repeat protein (TIGR04138 family)